jgi:dihydroorotate dehydrogenase
MDEVLKRLLFLMEPEASHHAALNMLATASGLPGGLAALRSWYRPPRGEPVELMGLRFPNRVGLAAGYDKNAVAWRGLAALGFGHVELGTVTPKPQAGNPTPRVFRLTSDRAIINRLGFPSEGAASVRARLSDERPGGVVVGVNIGKNKDTPLERAADDYVTLVKQLADQADYLAVNVSSPNTPGLRRLQTGRALEALLTAVVRARDERTPHLQRRVPVLVKLSPDLADADLDDAIEAVEHSAVDGIIATNTTLSRDGAKDAQIGEKGGLSGAPLTVRSQSVIGKIRTRARAGMPLIGVGGIMTADDAQARLDAGADLVQIYTGLVYGGPSLISRIIARTTHGPG